MAFPAKKNPGVPPSFSCVSVVFVRYNSQSWETMGRQVGNIRLLSTASIMLPVRFQLKNRARMTHLMGAQSGGRIAAAEKGQARDAK